VLYYKYKENQRTAAKRQEEIHMSTHVYIVNSTTFKVHLEYLFAGTGAKDYIVDFNDKKETSLAPAQERLLDDINMLW
jgi:hypothetical protein